MFIITGAFLLTLIAYFKINTGAELYERAEASHESNISRELVELGNNHAALR